MNEELEYIKLKMKERKIKELEEEAEKLKEEIERNKYGCSLKDLQAYFSGDDKD